jgi:hypothetical protein
VIVDLPVAYDGLGQASARVARNDGTSVPGVLQALVNGRTKVALEREWRLTMAVALRQLPSGACLTVRDSDGREWYVGPAAQAGVASFREAA